MAPRKAVESLFNLSTTTIEDYLSKICFSLLENDLTSTECLVLGERLRNLFYSLPRHLHEKVSNFVLKALHDKFLLEVHDQNLLKARLIASQLAGIIPNPCLTSFSHDSFLPEALGPVLLSALPTMTGLKVLNCNNFQQVKRNPGDCVHPNRYLRRRLLESMSSLSNLVEFSADYELCTDAIMAAVGGNCPALRKITVRSRCVTDASISHLSLCRKLEVVNITKTRVTARGLFQLLVGTPTLKEVKLGRHTRKILNFIARDVTLSSRTFRLEQFDLRQDISAQLEIVKKFFPLTKSLTFSDDESLEMPNLSGFSGLEYLSKLNLWFPEIDIGASLLARFGGFLSHRGANITTLLLGEKSEISVRDLVAVGLLCPNLKRLTLFSLLESVSSQVIFPVNPPFQNLQEFEVFESSVSLIRTVLCSALNVRWFSVTSVESLDELFGVVFQANPLSRLETLEIKGQGVLEVMLKRIIQKCERLTRIEYFVFQNDNNMSVEGSEQEESVFEFIEKNNYGVELILP